MLKGYCKVLGIFRGEIKWEKLNVEVIYLGAKKILKEIFTKINRSQGLRFIFQS